jgi:hypothetical protein
MLDLMRWGLGVEYPLCIFPVEGIATDDLGSTRHAGNY